MKKLVLSLLVCVCGWAHAETGMHSCEELRDQMHVSPGYMFTQEEWARFRIKLDKDTSGLGSATIGLLYLCGIGVQKDTERALQDFESAVSVGHANAYMAIYSLYAEFASDISPDPDKAQEWLQRGATAGVPELQSILAYQYWQKKDRASAERWLLKAAAQGFKKSYAVLSSLYMDMGKYWQAFQWAQVGAASGDAASAYLLGYLHTSGYGIPVDAVSALKWLTYAAEKNLLLAQVRLGRMLAIGKYVERDYENSLKWFRRAADQSSAQGLAGLANAYELGLGVPVDLKEAYRLRKEIPLAKNRIPLDEWSLKDVYSCPHVGFDAADVIFANSLDWFDTVANDARLKTAEYLVAKKESAGALCWFMLAIDNGHTESVAHLGKHYVSGENFPSNIPLGMYFLRQAAEKHNYFARTELADIYRHGIGVKKNLVLAYALNFPVMWDLNELDDVTGSYHPSVEDEMSAAQIKQAKKMIRELLEPGQYLAVLDRYTAQ